MTSAVASTSTGSQPNTSLYVRNLNTKTKKPELRRQLYSLFSTYGKVIDVVATRTEGMRGRAFVVFRDLSSATAARRALDGFEFYDRSIAIDYAHTQSKATIILEKGPEALFDPSLLASTSSTGPGPSTSSKNKITVSSAQADQRGREKKRAREEARQRGEVVDGEEEEEEESSDDEEDEGEPKSKLRKIEGADQGQKQAEEVEEQEEEEETAMDMADSDSDDDDAPGPAPPP